MAKKKRSGDPRKAASSSTRTTAKGTAPKAPRARLGDDAARRARSTGRPSSKARVTPDRRSSPSMLAAVLAELDKLHPDEDEEPEPTHAPTDGELAASSGRAIAAERARGLSGALDLSPVQSLTRGPDTL